MSPLRLFAPLAAALLLVAPLAAAHTFSGVISQGQTHSHWVDHGGSEPGCVDVVTTWTVTLRYTPTTDVLTLSVPEHHVSAVGAQGVAKVTFTTPQPCVSFTVVVQGTLIAVAAAYTVSVNNNLGH